MTTFTLPQRHVRSRRHYGSCPSAKPQQTGTNDRREAGRERSCGGDTPAITIGPRHRAPRAERLTSDTIEPLGLSDAFALLTLAAIAIVSLAGAIYAGHRILSEISTYTTMDVIRVFSAMP